jgi:hypothetical protein
MSFNVMAERAEQLEEILANSTNEITRASAAEQLELINENIAVTAFGFEQ